MAAIAVKPCLLQDVETLAVVGAAAFLDGFAGTLDGASIVRHCRDAHSVEAYREYLENGAQAWIAFEEKGAPVGLAMTTAPDLPGSADGDVELKRIYVLSRFHGSNAAGSLLEAAIAGAGAANRLVLGVYDQNHRALGFYAKHGFTQIDVRTFNMGGTIYSDVVLARNLTDPAWKSA